MNLSVAQFFAIFLSSLLLTRLLTTILHELGHAIPALILSKGNVEVYIGSYGNTEKSWKIKVGQLIIYFRYNPFLSRAGLCRVTDEDMAVWKKLVYVLGGPLLSLIVALVLGSLVKWGDYDGIYKMIFMILGVSCFYDFMVNIVPNDRKIVLHNGKTTKNDGSLIKDLLKFGNYPPEFFEASKYLQEKEYGKSAELYAAVINSGYNDKNLLRWYLHSLVLDKQIDKALEGYKDFGKKHRLNDVDYVNIGFCYSKKGESREAIKNYSLALKKRPDFVYGLNNRGYEFIRIGELERANHDLKYALAVDHHFAHAVANMGWLLLIKKEYDKAKEHLDKALKLDPNHAYAHRNYGIYYFDQGDHQQALTYFEKAKELDPNTDQIDVWLEQVKNELAKI